MHCSIIIPVHNKEAHVARAIRSVFRQTREDWELIVVDDASTDGSAAVVRQFDDPRLTVIRRDTPGPGGYRARNAGARTASGEWLSFLDADDEWDPGYLAAVAALRDGFPDAGLLSTGWRNVYGPGIEGPDRYYRAHAHLGNHAYDRSAFLRASVAAARPVCSSVATVRKSLLARAGGFPESGPGRGGDVDTWFRIMMTGATGAWAAVIGAVYHRDSQNMTTRRVAPGARDNHLLRSIHRALADERDPAAQALLREYRRAVERSIRRDLRQHRALQLAGTLLGPRLSRRLVEAAMRVKRGKEDSRP